MRHHLHLISQMRDRGWDDKELDYARHVMSSAHTQRTSFLRFFDSSLLWAFLIIVAIGNILAIATIMPLLILFSNQAIYGILILIGVCFGLLVELILRDIEHLFSGHHLFIMYVLIPFIAASGGLIVLTYAQLHLPNVFLLERNPLKMSIVYTIFFIAPLAISKFFRSRKNQAEKDKKEVL